MSASSNLLFVYGTLRRGQMALPDWQNRAGAILVGAGKARGLLYSFGRYPGAIFDSRAAGFVLGELYQLNHPDPFGFLDDYEEVDPVNQQSRAFVRETVSVEIENGRTVSAWAYGYRGSVEGCPLIASGDWLLSVMDGQS
jgi:gamma-glutamylcyclotransferase (GGCT)/AIG2-like uncharacterized protein YtfP